jgi:hypothetical protein
MKSDFIIQFLNTIGINKLIGVIGSGDSFKIAESVIHAGGEFIETPNEFSAPIIASSMNKVGTEKNFCASISIRGPGMVTSLPGIYHNFLEDLKSLSISESLSDIDSMNSFHKDFDLESALNSVSSNTKPVKKSLVDFDYNFKLNDDIRMVHLTSGNDNFFSYRRSSVEMCSNQKEKFGLLQNRKLFVVGKRGIQQSEVIKLLNTHVPFFLTPAALPYINLNLPNYLGVWTGMEQFKYLQNDSNFLINSTIIRLGVMKRELLTLKENACHFDIPLLPDKTKMNLTQFLEHFGLNLASNEQTIIRDLREKIAFGSKGWSVFTAIFILNELGDDYNLVFDVGSFATIIENYVIKFDKLRLHSSFIGKFMGTAASMAIGVSIAEPVVPVMCLIGEGGFAAAISEITAIASLQLPVCTIVFSNNAMHSVVSGKTIKPEHLNKYLPVNYAVLEKMIISDMPVYFAHSSEDFLNILNSWDKKSPILMFLKFEEYDYVKGVESLR